MASTRAFWRRLSGPTKVAIVCATVAILLTIIGQLRNPDQITPRSLLMGILIGGGSWGLVSWAIAYAAWDVESEIAAEEKEEASLGTGQEEPSGADAAAGEQHVPGDTVPTHPGDAAGDAQAQ